MKRITAPTDPSVRVETGYLDADVTPGSNVSLTLQNNDGFSLNDYVVIGYEGSELCEMQQINSAVTAGTVIQVGTVKFAHKKGEPVVRFRYNKRKFYGAITATGAYTELTGEGSPVQMQVDDGHGTVIEYAGTTYNYFKATYYNSQATLESDIADAEVLTGTETTRYASLYAIRKHAGLYDNPLYSDFRLETKRKQAENEIDSMLYAKYTLPLTEVPALISYICELLGAGYIDYEEFGGDGEGVKWLGEARSILKDIKKGDRILIGSDGAELPRKEDAGRLAGYPNDSTESDQGFMFTRDQTF